MSNGDLNWITNFIWGIVGDALRDLYVRGKYRDVILPMMVLHRLDAVLEPTKSAVLSMKDNLDKAGITNQYAALLKAAGQAFYNTSRVNMCPLTYSELTPARAVLPRKLAVAVPMRRPALLRQYGAQDRGLIVLTSNCRATLWARSLPAVIELRK